MVNLYKYVLLILILNSCFSKKVAEQSIDKAHQKFPDLVAKKTTEWFPCDIQVIKIDEKTKVIADSFNQDLRQRVVVIQDTIERIIKDTINDCSVLKSKLKQANLNINELKKSMQNEPFIIYRSVRVNDSARIYNVISELNLVKQSELKYRVKYENWLKVSLWLIIALAISLFINFYKK